MKNIKITHLCMNIMYYTISCCILGEHGDQERVTNGGDDIYGPEVPRQKPRREKQVFSGVEY
jgi:hypothetical protein